MSDDYLISRLRRMATIVFEDGYDSTDAKALQDAADRLEQLKRDDEITRLRALVAAKDEAFRKIIDYRHCPCSPQGMCFACSVASAALEKE